MRNKVGIMIAEWFANNKCRVNFMNNEYQQSIWARIRNEDIRKGLGVAKIKVKMKENRLKQSGHVQIRDISKPVRTIKCQSLRNLKTRQERPKMIEGLDWKRI